MSQLEDLAFIPENFSGRRGSFRCRAGDVRTSCSRCIFSSRGTATCWKKLADDRLIALRCAPVGENYEADPLEPWPVGTRGTRSANRIRVSISCCWPAPRALTRNCPRQDLSRSEVEVIEDEYPSGGRIARASLQRQLVARFRRSSSACEAQDQLDELLSGKSPGMLTTSSSYRVDVSCASSSGYCRSNVGPPPALLLKISENHAGGTADRRPLPPESA